MERVGQGRMWEEGECQGSEECQGSGEGGGGMRRARGIVKEEQGE